METQIHPTPQIGKRHPAYPLNKSDTQGKAHARPRHPYTCRPPLPHPRPGRRRAGLSQAYALVRSGDLVGIQIGGRAQWTVERPKLEDFIAEAYRRTAAQLDQLPTRLDD